MNKQDFDTLTKRIWETIMRTRDSGQNEYARDTEDVLANFRRIGLWKNESQESVLLTYLLKHIDGIISHVNGYVSQRESVKGRITDVMVYCMLLWAMTEEREMAETGKKK